MRGCRVERVPPRRRAACLILAAGFVAAPAAAQPIPLTPPPPAPPVSAPPGPAVDSQIQIAPLQPVDISWTGLLDPDHGGFPRDMWNGTGRNVVAELLPQLQPSASPELDRLAKRLLLSDATAPAGEIGGAALLPRRIDRIVAFGLVSDGLALIQSLPEAAVTEAIDRDRIELRFAADDSTGACKDIEARVARYPGVWWARALIACQALAGDFAKASLGQSLLADQKAPPDPEFDALIRLLKERGNGRLARLGDPTPLRLALLAAAKRPLPAEAIAVADPAALAGYASDTGLPPEDRLAAAERAQALGALQAKSLANLYTAIASKPEELARARQAMRPPADARDRALLYVLAKSGDDFAVRMAAIERLAADAQQHGVFVARAPLLAPALAGIPSADADPKFAGIAARVLLAAGNGDAAEPWVNAARDKATLLLDRIAQPGVPRLDTGLARDVAAADGDAATAQRASLLYALLTALGVDPSALDTLAPAALTAPVTPGALPNPALWDMQRQAAGGGRIGATVLATLLIAESDGRLTTEPLMLGRAVDGLRSVGLDGDAHTLALEAALDGGI